VERWTPPGDLLDVGTGHGDALDIAVERGWKAVGVEPIPAAQAVARANGHVVHLGRLQDLDLPPKSFDVVSASHVLEHLIDPVGFLRSLTRLTRRNGTVLVEVPNWSHSSRRRMGDQWDQLCPGEHVSFFTARTLKRTFRQAGLNAAVRSTTVVTHTPLADAALRGFALIAMAKVL
jgi:SAM-dependent methyltransferase